MKKKILIIINSEEYVRNYMTTSAFAEIEKYFLCTYLVSDKIIKGLDRFSKSNLIGHYLTNKSIEKRHYHLFNILMWKYRAKSSSFYFRAMRVRRQHFIFPEGYGFFKKLIRIPLRVFHWGIGQAIDFICNNNFIFQFYYAWLISRLPINTNLEEKIIKCKPDAILFPCSAYDPDGTDAVRVSKKIGVPTVFLIDNWDNLSSKSILWEKPSYVAVWGEQSCEHAINIQGFKKEQVISMGTPRFDEYFQVRDTDLKSNFHFKYILFVGTALAFDEADVLQKLNAVISKHSDIFMNVKIIYRPHPWRQGSDSINGKNLENIVIDPQMVDTYANNYVSKDFQPDLSYYPSLLKNAEFVVGGLTSMLIEALIFRKRFLALVYDDGRNYTSQHNAFKYFTHFQGLKDVEALSFCENIDTLETVFISTWLARNDINAAKIDVQRRFFYFDDARTYSQRLRDLCCDVTNKTLNNYGDQYYAK
jgi:hypothetical protein